MYSDAMSTTQKYVRKTVNVPSAVARRVQSLAKNRKTSVNRVLVDLIEAGLAAKDDERQHFLTLVDRLARTKDRAEQALLKDELAQLTFGD